VVGSILDAFDDPSLICLIRIGEFFDAFVSSVCDLREALRIPRLPRAVRAYLPRIASQPIELRFVITIMRFKFHGTSREVSSILVFIECQFAVRGRWRNFSALRWSRYTGASRFVRRHK
jgi:hypothetical protein